MKLGTALVLLGVLILLGIAIGAALLNSSPFGTSTRQVDVFEGAITDAAVGPGEMESVGAYDRNCTGISGGLLRCDAGLQTEQYGLLNFNYVHNMQKEPCIAPGERLRVRILDGQGRAIVERR